uniref:Peptidyl-prolyl cis-trans isomerase n=1 Tax=Lotharella oceanica TaxID=641309 RepID=A0A7S2XA31_9EUKA
MGSKNPIVEFKTNMGTFKVEVFVDKMPYTASNFVGLVKDKFYDGLTFHRVIDEFMLQFGGVAQVVRTVRIPRPSKLAQEVQQGGPLSRDCMTGSSTRG